MNKLKKLFKRIFGKEDNFPTNEEKATLWIARDKDDTLCLYNNRPYRFEGNDFFGIGVRELYICLDEALFPSVTYENSPQEVELKLVKK